MKHKIVFFTIFLALMVLMTGVTGAARNLVTNGGFEQPVVKEAWSLYDSIPGWTELDEKQLELQKSLWTPKEGKQYIELDSTESTTIYQDIRTVPGTTYRLTFAFSPRPGVADNQLQISWNGKIVDELSDSGAGKTDTKWKYHTYDLKAISKHTRLQFHDLDNSDSYGTFLDNVEVVKHNR